MLDFDEILTYFDEHHTRSAFRLEALDVYDVESDGADVARYLAGEDVPTATRKSPWLDQLHTDTAAGKLWSRVHVLATPLNDYLRYECEWGYVYNVAAGEDVRILDTVETSLPDAVIVREFWLFDDEHVLLMHYDDAGHLLGGEPLPPEHAGAYRAAAKAAWDAAQPFNIWWARHPEEHRSNRVVA